MDINKIKERAHILLKRNLIYSKDFFYTCPSLGTYQHQWLWDSCFHAIVWLYFNPDYAKKELKSLVKKQFPNGMLPHMCYWKKPSGQTPKLDDWLYRRWPEPDRSHITQPPLIAQTISTIYEKTQDRTFLEKMIPILQKYYDWLDFERNKKITGDGLITIIHPWESGQDLSPIWDYIHRISRLFTLRSALWLSKLVKKYNNFGWNIELIKKSNLFLVKEVAFNVIYTINLKILANLCRIIGKKQEYEKYLSRAKKVEEVLIKKCWDNDTHFFYSIHSTKEYLLREKTISGLFPLLLELDRKKIDYLIHNYLLNPEEFWLPFPIPSVAKSSRKFKAKGSSKLIWRGPTWFCSNWYIINGLYYHGFKTIAKHIIIKMCEMVEKSGFREQYNPITAKGYGARNFGWSTLIVDLINKIE